RDRDRRSDRVPATAGAPAQVRARTTRPPRSGCNEEDHRAARSPAVTGSRTARRFLMQVPDRTGSLLHPYRARGPCARQVVSNRCTGVSYGCATVTVIEALPTLRRTEKGRRMSPRRRADHLTEEQLGELGAALAEGRRATVYLVEGIPSLGIDPGTSARVVSISGSTVMVRPKGVDDELPFETDELRATREPAGTKRAPAKAARTSGSAKPAPAKATPAKAAPVQPATPRATAP